VAGGAAELPVAGRGVRPHRDVAVIGEDDGAGVAGAGRSASPAR
jgi:hypothetical protein